MFKFIKNFFRNPTQPHPATAVWCDLIERIAEGATSVRLSQTDYDNLLDYFRSLERLIVPSGRGISVFGAEVYPE